MKSKDIMSKGESSRRFREILSILNKHKIVKGLTPQKLRSILEDLGPTYIKLGQIMSMSTDMIPAVYCSELAKLRTDVAPMGFDEVRTVVESSCGCILEERFASFDREPLGSASIAQVHKASLIGGGSVVVKVQRTGIYDIMSRDIALLRKASRFLKLVGGTGGVIDFDMILNELWNVSQEEMNFLIEAKNTEEFHMLNRDTAFVTCPKIYRDLTTSKVLIMDYIDGYAINDRNKLQEQGYDLSEIASKLADNYMKQIIDDGFFQADPHPGNIKISGGKIVWIDLGMMGRLSARDQDLFGKAIIAVARHDVDTIRDIILTMGVSKGRVDHSQLYADIDDMLARYGSIEIGNINLTKVIEEVMGLAKEHQIAMPSGMSMLARGVAIIEGVVADLCADISFIDITASRMTNNYIKNIDWKKGLSENTGNLFVSGKKAIELPSLLHDILKMSVKGQTRINMELHKSDDFSKMANKLLDKLIVCILIASLLVSSSLISTTNMQPKFFGIPALGFLGYIAAFILSIWLLISARKSI
jgi:ubiquinone biosynthesis protein